MVLLLFLLFGGGLLVYYQCMFVKESKPAAPWCYHNTFISDGLVHKLREIYGEVYDPPPSGWGRPRKLISDQHIDIFLAYYREGVTMRFLGHCYGVSHCTISSVIKKVESFLLDYFHDHDVSLPQALDELAGEDGKIHEELLLDGTLICTAKHNYHPRLYSGKHKINGFNIQVLGNHRGEICFVSAPFPGSYHDKKCYDLLKLSDNSRDVTIYADKGYQGTNLITPTKRSSKLTLEDKENNRIIHQKRSVIERIISRIKNWKIIKHRYRKPPDQLPKTLKIITILEKLNPTF